MSEVGNIARTAICTLVPRVTLWTTVSQDACAQDDLECNTAWRSGCNATSGREEAIRILILGMRSIALEGLQCTRSTVHGPRSIN